MLRLALAVGLRAIDTAWYYGPETANRLIAQTIRPYPEDIFFIAKVGNSRHPATREYVPEIDPHAIRAACERSLSSLQVDAVSLLLLRWRADLDHKDSFDLAWEEVCALQREGKAIHIGLSNVDIPNIERAISQSSVAAVSNAYSIFDRSDEHVVNFCVARGMAYIPYYPLKRGGPSLDGAFATIARRCGSTPAQIALAWLLKRSELMFPIPGMSQCSHLMENVGSLDLKVDELNWDLLIGDP